MTVVDMDDTIFAEDSRFPVEEMDMIEEENENNTNETLEQWNEGGPKQPQPLGNSHSHNSQRNNIMGNSSSSARFQYPSTLDDEETAVLTGGGNKNAGSGAGGATVGPKNNKKKKRAVQKNRDFKDVEETGKWGTVSRKEIIGVGTLLSLFLVGAAAGLYVWLSSDSGGDNNGPPTTNITDAKFFLSKQEHYEDLINKINQRAPAEIAETLLQTFPASVDDLGGDDAYSEAAMWLFYTDEIPVKWERNVVPRFVLAATYIGNGGRDHWLFQDNWMSVKEVCDWHGVKCDMHGRITEIDLSGNGLTGPLHAAWSLLPECGSILLSDNALTGTIPGAVFGNMAKLIYLHLDDNQLTGTIPLSLKDTESLGTCFFFAHVFCSVVLC